MTPKSLKKHLFAAAAAAVLIAATGCDKRPEGILSESTTINVLSDLQLAEAYMNTNAASYSDQQSRHALKLAVLSKHNVTEKQFDATLDWYGHNMDKYSKLYEKVAKRLEKEKNHDSGSSDDGAQSASESLWPYGRLLAISNLGNTDGIHFSINTGFEKGDQIEWKMRVSKPAPLEAVLGVEYGDGAFSLIERSFGGSTKINLKLQCDSTRTIKRAFGILRTNSISALPLWADSISLTTAKMSSDTYYIFNSQQNILPPGQNRRKAIEAAAEPKGENDDSSLPVNLPGAGTSSPQSPAASSQTNQTGTPPASNAAPTLPQSANPVILRPGSKVVNQRMSK